MPTSPARPFTWGRTQRAKILGTALFARTAVIDGDADLRHSQITGEANFRDAKIGKHLLLAGAAVAWYAAGFGGRHRDGEAIPAFWLNRPGVPVRGMP